MSKHKQPGGIWTAQYAHCALYSQGEMQPTSYQSTAVKTSCMREVFHQHILPLLIK